MHRFAFAVAATAFLAVPCIAQSSPTVTEAEFLSSLNDGHPALVAGREVVALAEAETARARRLSNPRLAATREAPSALSDQLDLTVAWQLPHPSRGPTVAAREQKLEAAKERFANDVLALRVSMREAFADWAVLSELAIRVELRATTVSDLAQREKQRAERGESSGLEAGRLALAAAELQSRLALLESEALEAAATARGWNPALRSSDRPVLPRLPPPPVDFGDGHPVLMALESETEAARLSSRASARYVDSPELVAGWQSVKSGQATFEGPIVGLSWEIPLVHRNQAERALADAGLENALARLGQARLRIETERTGVLAAYRHLVAAAEASRDANAANERLVDATMASFRAGEASLTDLLDTVGSVLDAESTAVELHAAALDSHRRLERLAGRPLDLD